MSGNSFLIDTNIALYLLSGNETLRELLGGTKVYVSFITQLELLGYKGITQKERVRVQTMLKDCSIIDINDGIKAQTIAIRESQKMKLPDSIIAATSIFMDLPLVSADRGFLTVEGLRLVFFEE
jgi:predicted nucleic acid-binding protein